MKVEIHPQYYPEAKITCGCGAVYQTGSTREALQVEICRACHPFFSGEDKVIDTAGRVEKFTRRRATAAALPPKKVKAVRIKKVPANPAK